LENLQYTSSSQNQRHSRNQRHDQRPSESDSSAFRAGAGQAQHGREPRLFEEFDQLLDRERLAPLRRLLQPVAAGGGMKARSSPQGSLSEPGAVREDLAVLTERCEVAVASFAMSRASSSVSPCVVSRPRADP